MGNASSQRHRNRWGRGTKRCSGCAGESLRVSWVLPSLCARCGLPRRGRKGAAAGSGEPAVVGAPEQEGLLAAWGQRSQHKPWGGNVQETKQSFQYRCLCGVSSSSR